MVYGLKKEKALSPRESGNRMDKKEIREKKLNLILVAIGIILALVLIIIPRGGLSSITSTNWSDISLLKWILIAGAFFIALVLQYYLLLLLRYSFLKYLVLWMIPIIWVFSNGLVAMHRFLDWTTDIVSPAGWLPITDLISWILGAVFLPSLIGCGIIAAMIDTSVNALSQACYYANIAMDVANISPWNFIDYSMNFISVLWDLISNSFVQEVIKERSAQRSFFDISFSDAFSLPQWIVDIGYSFTCLII